MITSQWGACSPVKAWRILIIFTCLVQKQIVFWLTRRTGGQRPWSCHGSVSCLRIVKQGWKAPKRRRFSWRLQSRGVCCFHRGALPPLCIMVECSGLNLAAYPAGVLEERSRLYSVKLQICKEILVLMKQVLQQSDPKIKSYVFYRTERHKILEWIIVPVHKNDCWFNDISVTAAEVPQMAVRLCKLSEIKLLLLLLFQLNSFYACSIP